MAHIVIAGGQEHIRQVLAMCLVDHGHDVLEAASGEAALRALQQQPVDVLITDAHVRTAAGARLLPVALDRCANLRRVFVIAGSLDRAGRQSGEADPRVSLLAQPFSPTKLVLDVAAAMSAGSAARTPAFRYQATTAARARGPTPPPIEPGGEA